MFSKLVDFILSPFYWLLCACIFVWAGFNEFGSVLDNQTNDAYFLLWFVSAAFFFTLFLYSKDKNK